MAQSEYEDLEKEGWQLAFRNNDDTHGKIHEVYLRNLTEDELDDKIDQWHNGEGEGQELYEYLGWTFEQYKNWVEGKPFS